MRQSYDSSTAFWQKLKGGALFMRKQVNGYCNAILIRFANVGNGHNFEKSPHSMLSVESEVVKRWGGIQPTPPF